MGPGVTLREGKKQSLIQVIVCYCTAREDEASSVLATNEAFCERLI